MNLVEPAELEADKPKRSIKERFSLAAPTNPSNLCPQTSRIFSQPC